MDMLKEYSQQIIVIYEKIMCKVEKYINAEWTGDETGKTFVPLTTYICWGEPIDMEE